MNVPTPSGTTWCIEDAPAKLRLRAGLPGARVFDLAADALRHARLRGVPAEARLALALPGSWLVNSPAPSTLLRRWALPPAREAFVTWLEVMEGGPESWAQGAARFSAPEVLPLLFNQPEAPGRALETTSKVLALLVPESMPLLPSTAVDFVLGASEEGAPPRPPLETFLRVVDWFTAAVLEHFDALAAIAGSHAEAPLDAAQVLDRLLWFDSEGYRHLGTGLKCQAAR